MTDKEQLKKLDLFDLGKKKKKTKTLKRDSWETYDAKIWKNDSHPMHGRKEQKTGIIIWFKDLL